MKFNRVYLPQQKAIQTRQMNASNDAFARQPAAAVSNRAGSALSMPFARPEQNGFGPNNRILVIANNFPPIKGGSPTVYVNLARHLRDRVVVLAPKTNYKDGTPLIGWQQHDQAASYKIHRLPLLRTRLDQEKIPGFLGCFRFMVSDLWIRARVSASILWLVLFCKIRIICIGELLASAWLIAMCGWIPFIRTVTYVHGEEITTAVRDISMLADEFDDRIVEEAGGKRMQDLIDASATAALFADTAALITVTAALIAVISGRRSRPCGGSLPEPSPTPA